MPGHLGAVSLKKSHDIIILSFCNIVKGQAKYTDNESRIFFNADSVSIVHLLLQVIMGTFLY